MKCPICNVELFITDRQGIEIDYCPKCRGIWLDRGELDKIIERSSANYSQGKSFQENGTRDLENKNNRGKHNERSKRNILEDLFDF